MAILKHGRRNVPGLLLAAIVTMAACWASPAPATIISADFSTSADNAQLLNNTLTDGSGWVTNSNWGASTGTGGNTSKIKLHSGLNLTTNMGGYDVAQTGSGVAYGDYNAFRGINRYTTSMSGEIWFSVLVQNLNALNTDRAGIQFNNHAMPTSLSDYDRGPWDVALVGTDLQVRYNGTNSASLATLAVNQTHLLLGKLTIGAGNDTMQVWADPADLNNLGTPLFSQSDADMGSTLYLAGIFAWGSSSTANIKQGYIDALRISDGGGNAQQAFSDVTGMPVPEPGTLVLLCLAAAPLAALRWFRRVRASQ